jgi:arginyl-tRNA synthetase
MFREVAELCLKGFEETLKELGISFDSFDFESKFVLDSSVKKLVEELRQRGHLKKTEEGTWLLDLSTFGKPSLVLVRSDGTTLYTTRDIAYHIWKFEQGIERTINVIGAEQALAQAQLRHALKLLGMEKQSKSTIHLSYAHVRFPGVRFSGRRGRYLTIDELLRRAYEKALREVEKRNPGLSEAQKQRIARIVGRGAIKYAILKVDPNKEITFDLEKALSFEGDTGPYLQYAYTRCCGILRKAGEWKPSFEPTKLSPRERELIRLLAQLPEIIGSAARELRPHYICNFAYELATAFSLFYQFCPVLRAEPGVRDFRLTLVDKVRFALKELLSLLGIEVTEVM